MLPLAWGLSWRAVAKRRSYALAALAVALTIACTCSPATSRSCSIGVWVLLKPPEILRRLGRAAIVASEPCASRPACSCRCSLDVSVMPQSEYSPRHDLLRLVRREADPRVVVHRPALRPRAVLAVISLLVLAGSIVCLLRFRRDERARAVLAVPGSSASSCSSGGRRSGRSCKILPGQLGPVPAALHHGGASRRDLPRRGRARGARAHRAGRGSTGATSDGIRRS